VDPELVALIVALAAGGSTWIAARGADHPSMPRASGAALERDAWRKLSLPLLPQACAALFALGWALVEPPVADEVPPVSLLVAAALYAVVVLRAVVRGAMALRGPRRVASAAVVGLLRPRVVVCPAFMARLDPEAREAVLAHEAAHATAHDPLRVLAAQLLADLQWPLPGARRRLLVWREAVELARDEEARRSGIDGAALAAGILEASRVTADPRAALVAITGRGDAALRQRVARLLEPIPLETPAPAPWTPWLCAAAMIVAVGAMAGDPVLGAVCAVLP
jgi:hypothetical protein